MENRDEIRAFDLHTSDVRPSVVLSVCELHALYNARCSREYVDIKWIHDEIYQILPTRPNADAHTKSGNIFFRPHRVRVPPAPARESLAPYFTANAEIGIALLTE